MECSLGRLHSEDSRDTRFMMAAIAPTAAPDRTWRYWYTGGWWGDQGQTPMCVGYSWIHWAEDGPVTIPSASVPFKQPSELYHAAQEVDEWAGTSYDGTSVRAGAKVLQSWGIINSYYWAWDANTVVNTLLTTGPVVVGTNWYNGMFEPTKEGIVKVQGAFAGGHAYVLDGVNKKTGLIRIKNSWGRSWGRNGFGYISIKDMDKLLINQGEACLATQNKL